MCVPHLRNRYDHVPWFLCKFASRNDITLRKAVLRAGSGIRWRGIGRRAFGNRHRRRRRLWLLLFLVVLSSLCLLVVFLVFLVLLVFLALCLFFIHICCSKQVFCYDIMYFFITILVPNIILPSILRGRLVLARLCFFKTLDPNRNMNKKQNNHSAIDDKHWFEWQTRYVPLANQLHLKSLISKIMTWQESLQPRLGSVHPVHVWVNPDLLSINGGIWQLGIHYGLSSLGGAIFSCYFTNRQPLTAASFSVRFTLCDREV